MTTLRFCTDDPSSENKREKKRESEVFLAINRVTSNYTHHPI